MKKIKLFSLILSLLLCLSACQTPQAEEYPVSAEKTETEEKPSSTLLQETEDYGQEYLDSFIFFGESTTYHLKSRGVLSGGKNTNQVWGTDNGTAMLDRSITTLRIRYPETGELLTIAEACARKKPTYLLLTFGLNGAVQNVKMGEEYFKRCYKKLIGAIRASSPNTTIILQSAFPVAENMDMSAYSVSLKTLNEYIDLQNSWSYSLACEENCKYLDTSSVLKDENNNLKTEYQVGDGHHLTAEAYEQILYYIRTHG